MRLQSVQGQVKARSINPRDLSDFLGLPYLHPNEPYQLNFAISYFCVSGCKNCNIWKLGAEAKQGELTLEEVRQLSSHESSFRWIRFTGGEPFMRKDLVDIVRSFHANCTDLRIVNSTTNAFSPDYICDAVRMIAKLGIENVIIGISLDGYRDLHNYIRGVDSFDKAITLYKKLKDVEGVRAIFSYTISKHNVGKFSESFNAVREEIPDIEISDFNFNMYETSAIYYRNEKNNFTDSESQRIANEFVNLSELRSREKANSLIDKIVNRYVDLVPTYLETRQSPITCSAIRSSVFLDPYGNLYPCITWGRFLGNIRDTGYSINRLLRSAQSTRDLVVQKKCPGCWTPCEAHSSIIDSAFD